MVGKADQIIDTLTTDMLRYILLSPPPPGGRVIFCKVIPTAVARTLKMLELLAHGDFRWWTADVPGTFDAMTG